MTTRLYLPLSMLLALVAIAMLSLHLPKASPAGDFSPPPSLVMARAMALGDDGFAFRRQALMLQHTGNLDGSIVPYDRLNYANLAAWLALQDRLDDTAEITPTMVGFLFGCAWQPAHVGLMVDYLERRALAHPVDDWRWLGQAVWLARYRMHDLARAQTLAHALSTLPIPLPPWARQMEVFILVAQGNKDDARNLLSAIAAADPAMPDTEKRWMQVYALRHFAGP